MNAIDFIQFLGHSSIQVPFDDFLTSQGISWRPKVGRTLDTTHFINGQGLVMTFEFDSAAAEEGIKVKSEGDYLFNDFTVQFIAEDKKTASTWDRCSTTLRPMTPALRWKEKWVPLPPDNSTGEAIIFSMAWFGQFHSHRTASSM